MFSQLFRNLLAKISANLKSSGFSLYEFFVIVSLVLLLTVGVRFYRLAEPKNYYFDEVYHAMTVKLVAKNDPRAYEYTHGDTIEKGTYVEWLHPPVAKYFQALGVVMFGANSFGWRFSTAVFGVLVVMMIGRVSWQLFRSISVSLTALYLASLETLLIAQSRIAMNDIFVAFFALLTFSLYIHFQKKQTFSRLILVGVAGGLALASKWSGLFIIGWAICMELFALGQKMYTALKKQQKMDWAAVVLKPTIIRIFALVAVPAIVYVTSYWQMFAQGKDFVYFIDLHKQIIGYQTRLDATHPYQSTPQEWFLDVKPVWYFVDYDRAGRRDVYAIGNPIIFWFGGISAVALSLYLLARKGHSQFQQQFFFLTTAYWLVWLPWILSPRIMFFYHYVPAVPFLIIIMAVVLMGLWGDVPKWLVPATRQMLYLRQVTVIAVFSAATGAFIWLLPQIIALSVPTWWKDSLFLGGLWK